MKAKATYAQVKEALEDGFVSPLNSDVNIDDICLVTVESAGRSKDLADVEGHKLEVNEFLSLFRKLKTKKENDFLTYTIGVNTYSGYFSVTMFNSIKTPIHKDFDHILDEFDYLKRHGKI